MPAYTCLCNEHNNHVYMSAMLQASNGLHAKYIMHVRTPYQTIVAFAEAVWWDYPPSPYVLSKVPRTLVLAQSWIIPMQHSVPPNSHTLLLPWL